MHCTPWTGVFEEIIADSFEVLEVSANKHLAMMHSCSNISTKELRFCTWNSKHWNYIVIDQQK